MDYSFFNKWKWWAAKLLKRAHGDQNQDKTSMLSQVLAVGDTPSSMSLGSILCEAGMASEHAAGCFRKHMPWAGAMKRTPTVSEREGRWWVTCSEHCFASQRSYMGVTKRMPERTHSEGPARCPVPGAQHCGGFDVATTQGHDFGINLHIVKQGYLKPHPPPAFITTLLHTQESCPLGIKINLIFLKIRKGPFLFLLSEGEGEEGRKKKAVKCGPG